MKYFQTLTFLVVGMLFIGIFFFTPEEASQGIVQKIFYIHVASAMTMYLGFFLTFLCGIMYLSEKKIIWDEIAVSCAETGWLFCTAVLLTGPIWARPIWGVWWTWEPRLTTTFLLWLIYSAYLFTRNALEDSHKKALISAILSIIAFVDIPLVHYSVKLWRGVHPTVVNSKGGLPSSMKLTLSLSIVAFFMLYAVLTHKRFKIERSRNQVNEVLEGL